MVPVYRMKVYTTAKVQLRHYMCFSVYLHAPATLPPEKRPQHPSNRSVCGSEARLDVREELNLVLVPGFEPLIIQP
jgi:hypothetical protein